MTELRADLRVVADWIQPGARILDLGCGDGSLLAYLHRHRRITSYGLEIDPDKIVSCVGRGLNVLQTDLDEGLSDFEAGSFDQVIMTQTLQAVQRPDELLDEMLRVGNEGIVTFPNFAHWRLRYQHAVQGRMPMSGAFAYSWYDSPNIHVCTVRDFEELCAAKHIQLIEREVMSHDLQRPWLATRRPNLFGEMALYRFCRAE